MKFSRRKLLSFALLSPILGLTACVATSPKQTVVEIDSSKVTDIPSLLVAMKTAAENRISIEVKDEDAYLEIAGAFVRNAKAAAMNGFNIPQWVLDKLPPNQPVVVPVLGVAMFSLWGVIFMVPVSTIIMAVLASILLMTSTIIITIKAIFGSDNPSESKAQQRRV